MSVNMRALWGRRTNKAASPTPYRASQSDEGSRDGFRFVSFYDSEDQWLSLSQEYNSKSTPEIRALITVPGYDRLE